MKPRLPLEFHVFCHAPLCNGGLERSHYRSQGIGFGADLIQLRNPFEFLPLSQLRQPVWAADDHDSVHMIWHDHKIINVYVLVVLRNFFPASVHAFTDG